MTDDRVYDVSGVYAVGALGTAGTVVSGFVDGVAVVVAAPLLFVYLTYVTLQVVMAGIGFVEHRQEVAA